MSTVKTILGITKPKLSIIQPIISPPTKAPSAWPTSIKTILKRRFSGGFISAIYEKHAMKTAVDAPVKPCRRPVRMSTLRSRSSAMTMVDMAQAITWAIIWGTMANRRPLWSLIVPMIKTTNTVGSKAAIINPVLHKDSSSWKAASLPLTLVPFCPRRRQASLSVRFSDTVFVMLYLKDMRSWMYCCVSGARQVNMVTYSIMTGSTVNHRWPNWDRYSLCLAFFSPSSSVMVCTPPFPLPVDSIHSDDLFVPSSFGQTPGSPTHFAPSPCVFSPCLIESSSDPSMTTLWCASVTGGWSSKLLFPWLILLWLNPGSASMLCNFGLSILYMPDLKSSRLYIPLSQRSEITPHVLRVYRYQWPFILRYL